MEEASLPLFVKAEEPRRLFLLCAARIVAAVAGRGHPISQGANEIGSASSHANPGIGFGTRRRCFHQSGSSEAAIRRWIRRKL